MKKILFILNIILLIAWMGLIFSFSHEPGVESGGKSSKFLIKTVEILRHEKLTPEEKKEIVSKYGNLVRKLAHMFLYFVLAILAFALLIKFYNLKPVTIIYTLIFCFIYACSDEFHQWFIPNRHASIMDVLIDTFGSIIFLIFPTLILLKRKIVTNK